MPGSKFDCLIIGGGHNGLVAAAYLARGGKRVCVLERRHLLGGCSCTEELWPGYKVSTASYVISLFRPEIIKQLKLASYGLSILPRSPSSFTPLLDGRSLTLGPDAKLNRQEIGKFSKKDAEAYPRYEELLDRVSRSLEPILQKAAPNPLPLPTEWRSLDIATRLRDAGQLWELYQAAGGLGRDLPEAIELLVGPARPILERWFESEVLRATLATDAVIGTFQPPSAPGTAYVLLHHVMGEVGGKRGVWGYVRGGMGGLADALAKACRDLGVEIRRDSPVRNIIADSGRVRGVVLEDGRFLEAPVVGSTVDPHLTFERFLGPQDLPEDFRRAVARIDYSSASMKINVALSEPPRFRMLPQTGVPPQLHGTIHISPTLDTIERAYEDARAGRPSSEPILECTIPSSVDPTLAPEGHFVMSMFIQYAPYQLAQGSWDDIKESFADRCLELLGRYAPNIPGAVLHRQVLSPLDLERTYGITGGNIFQGAMAPHQLFFFRPVPGWADHRTPIQGLYLCGAAAHPGGGVIGACGKNAAEIILADGY